MRKKFTMLFAALLACVGVVKAGVTDLPELSTEGNIKWYTIKNVNCGKYAAYTGDGAQMTLNSEVVDASYLFYFTAGEATAEGATVVKIHNYVTNKLCAGYNSWNDTGIDWYLNAQEKGVSISNSTDYTNNNSSWNNFQGAGKKIAYYNAADGGSAWVIEPYEGNIVLNNLKMSTDAEKHFYFIQNRRQNGKFANYVASGTALSQTTSAGAGSYWYFVDASNKLPEGTNVPDDYKACYIYNAATAEPLNSPDNGSVASVDKAPIFYIRKSSYGNFWDFVIYDYKGTNGWNDKAGVVVCTHSINDGGSIWSIVEAGKTEAELIAAAKAVKESAASLMPIAKEAYYYSYPQTAIAAIEKAVANFIEENLAAAVSSQLAIEKALKEKRTAAPAAGDFIMLKNKAKNQYMTTMESGDEVHRTSDKNDPKALWQVVAGDDSKVKLYNAASEKYLGAISQSQPVLMVEEADAAQFTFSNVTDVYAAFTSSGGQYTYAHMDGWYDRVVGWEPGADATQWIVSNVRPLSIIYLLNGEKLSASTEYVSVGTYTVSSPYNYTSVEACTLDGEELTATNGVFSFEVTNETKSLTVNLVNDLPFETTTITDGKFAADTKWYVLKQRSANHIWVYDETNNVQVKKEAYSIYNPAHLWCFTGNAIEGVKIYNKAAGVGCSLDNENPAKLVKDNDAVWSVETSDASFTESDLRFAFKRTKNDTGYANESGGNLVDYWVKDAGSTSCAVSVSAEAAKIAAAWDKYFVTEEEGAVGSLTTTDGLQDLIDAYLAEPSQDTENAVTEFIADNKIELTAGYYFIKGTGEMNDNSYYVAPGSNKPWYATHFVKDGVNSMKAVELQEGQKLNANHVWKFEAEEEGYKLQQVNLGTYATLIAAGGTSTVTANYAKGDKFTFELTDGSTSKFIIKNGNGDIMRTENDGRINHWGGEVKEAWYLVPVTELEISISEFASICMPFNVEVEGATAYAITATNATSENATLTAVSNVIPAGQGAILEAKGENTTATLKLTDEKSDWTGNLLQGTTVNTYVAGPAYVLANGSKGVGLYKAKLNKGAEGAEGTTHFLNNANKAYLPAPAGAGAAMFSFDRGEGTTSIEDVEFANDNVVIYDLAGRRVEKMVKGIYIVNGKKVVIK